MKLDPKQHDWLQSAPVQSLMAALGPQRARFVGGCVRNALMSEPVGDIDICTQHSPEQTMDALAKAGIKSIPTGIDHGTITAVIEGIPYEITSLRKDVATDGRRAVVSFTQDWDLDAQRRDFTVNALYVDYNGQIYDPTGQGLEDIKKRRFRFIGKADDRVREDYLRILRYFRFIAYYAGDNTLDKNALKACRENVAGLKTLSVERIWSELKKLLSAPDPSRIVHIMLRQGILEAVMPEASNADGLEQFIRFERRESLEADPLLRLMALASRLPLPMALLTKRLKMSKAETLRLRQWANDDTPLSPDMAERDKLAAIYKCGKRLFMDRCLIRSAGEDDAVLSARWMSLVDLALGWTPPRFPIGGKDLIAAGVPPGDGLGRKLDALKALWIKSGFQADKDKLLMALKLLGPS